MDPNKVFKLFLNLCNEQTGFLEYYLASNAIVEWFGKTIRGKERIRSFYRYDFSQEYEHHFEDVQQCRPIEKKVAHFQTRQLSFSDIKMCEDSLIKIEPSSEFKTPEQDRKSPVLPRLNQGRIFCSVTDDDSYKSDLLDLGVYEIQETIMSPQTYLPNASEPVQKRVKKTDIVIDKNNFPQKNDNHSNLEMEIEQSQQNNSNNYIMCDSIAEYYGDSSSSSTCNGNTNSLGRGYSNLMYLEASGILRIINRQKHRDKKSTYDEGNYDRNPIFSSSLNRETRLKISYRINESSNQVQFALIIYESANPSLLVRRNLYMEFEEVEELNKDTYENHKRKTAFNRSFRL